jgi:hypothetical protein
MTTNSELGRLCKALDKEELASRLAECAADLQTQRLYLLDYAKTARKTIPNSMEMLGELIASAHNRLILDRTPSEDISDRVFDALWPEVEGRQGEFSILENLARIGLRLVIAANDLGERTD